MEGMVVGVVLLVLFLWPPRRFVFALLHDTFTSSPPTHSSRCWEHAPEREEEEGIPDLISQNQITLQHCKLSALVSECLNKLDL